MTDLWMAVAPNPGMTRLLVTRGPQEPLLKANLRKDPQHPRALPTLIEALALWEGRAIRAALVADERSTTCGSSLFHELFAEHDGGPLFTLDVVWDRRPKRRGRDGLSGLGDFRDLQRLLAQEVAR